jgi:hypothetical protein
MTSRIPPIRCTSKHPLPMPISHHSSLVHFQECCASWRSQDLLLVPAFWAYGWLGAAGFAAGVAVSYINFLALARGVEGLADRIVNQHSQEKGRSIVLRFLLRYGLVAVVAYAIFKGSALAFRGFLWGLCVPVAAMMIEAGFEAYAAFRRE